MRTSVTKAMTFLTELNYMTVVDDDTWEITEWRYPDDPGCVARTRRLKRAVTEEQLIEAMKMVDWGRKPLTNTL